MKNKFFFKSTVIFLLLFLTTSSNLVAQVGIGTTDPHPSSVLDVQSTTKGVLLPRMTTAQRDAIVAPAAGLQIFNTTKNSEEFYSGTVWKTLNFSINSNLVYVFSIADLPASVSNNITLDATKMYIFSGFVDISPNYITINGAGLRGTDPQKDILASNVSGAILRSTNTSIFIQDLAIAPNSASTKAYDVSDSTGTKYFNSFAGASVVELVTSLGVGQVSGFKAITFIKNFWKVSDGIKITGTVGKFTSVLNFIEGISTGSSGIEFLGAINIQDIDLSNNYFIYSGNTGVKVNVGATVSRGRMTTNMFRGVTTPLLGVDSYSTGWNMVQNTGIPDSRASCFIFFNNNTTSTTLTTPSTFYKIAGTTTTIGTARRFTASNNRITYNNVDAVTSRISVIITAKTVASSSDFSIGIAKNGIIITAPLGTMSVAGNNSAFQIVLITEVDLVQNDFLEVFITSNNASNNALIVEDMQFRVVSD